MSFQRAHCKGQANPAIHNLHLGRADEREVWTGVSETREFESERNSKAGPEDRKRVRVHLLAAIRGERLQRLRSVADQGALDRQIEWEHRNLSKPLLYEISAYRKLFDHRTFFQFHEFGLSFYRDLILLSSEEIAQTDHRHGLPTGLLV